jgi:adhesin/invasin
VFALAALASVSCDRAQLLAPTSSTITLTSATRVLPANGTTTLTAFVIEQSGTPVQNGTLVRFITTLGRVEPSSAQTQNGLATATFFAGDLSGIAEVRALSGGAGGGTTSTGTGTSATTAATNVIQITVGAAAVNTVTLRANPASVGPGGGSVELIATVVGENGRALEGILVTFNANQGTLSSATAVTNSSGEARTTLTTSQETKVNATAGTKTSTPDVTITVRSGPGISLTCTPTGSGTLPSNCASIQASSTSNTATVVLTIERVSGSSTLRVATMNFGDGTSQSLGNLPAKTTVTHTYNGPSGQSPAVYIATVQATDINGESTSASTTVVITPRPTPTPINVTILAENDGAATISGQRWKFTATAKGGGEGTTDAPIESYKWDFGDGESATTSGNTTAHIYDTEVEPQKFTVTVTARTADGRTATGRTEILVHKFPL